VFIVEIPTRSGRVCERFTTYEAARERIDAFPPESLAGLPLIFQDLPDGSERLVCEDGKPLQWHRLPWDEPEQADEGPLSTDPGDAGPAPL